MANRGERQESRRIESTGCSTGVGEGKKETTRNCYVVQFRNFSPTNFSRMNNNVDLMIMMIMLVNLKITPVNRMVRELFFSLQLQEKLCTPASRQHTAWSDQPSNQIRRSFQDLLVTSNSSCPTRLFVENSKVIKVVRHGSLLDRRFQLLFFDQRGETSEVYAVHSEEYSTVLKERHSAWLIDFFSHSHFVCGTIGTE